MRLKRGLINWRSEPSRKDPVKIYNSLKRKKEEFSSINEGRIGMYVCGPTVYDEPHIGHARSAYIFDCIRRYLSYKGYAVTFVRNVTDVDDKIIDKARKVSAGQGQGPDLLEATIEISKKYLDAYHRDMDILGIKRPDKEPKATEYIPKMVEFIKVLIDRGAAYASGGDVYFDIKKASHYGKLSNQNLEKMEAGARVSSGENKLDPLDFALWKKAKEGEPSWPSPWSAGRPGWHIECSVMSSDILGGEFDIHGGGIDLIFPHHENEIAQSEGAGNKFARYWMHNGLLTINGEKMAKSAGNFISIQDFIAKYKDPDYLKLFFLSAHYSSPIDYTDEKIKEAIKQKERIGIFLRNARDTIENVEQGLGGKPLIDSRNSQALSSLNCYKGAFEKAMDDDFNTPGAIAEIFNIVHYGNSLKFEFNKSDEDSMARDIVAYEKLKYAKNLISELLPNVLGLFEKEEKLTLSKIEQILIKERNEARKNKKYKESDEFRQILLKEHNIILEDTKDGTVWRRKI